MVKFHITVVVSLLITPVSIILWQPPLLGHGQGRLSVLDEPVTVETAIRKTKSHLGLTHLRLALGVGKMLGIRFLPLCFDLNVNSMYQSACVKHTFLNAEYPNCYRFVK